MRSWRSSWSSGVFSFRDDWCVTLSLPLMKERSGGAIDVRNILLVEPMVKLSSALAYEARSRRAMQALVHVQQFALGSDGGGAVGMLMRADAEMRAAGDEACVLSTDISNAYGRVR